MRDPSPPRQSQSLGCLTSDTASREEPGQGSSFVASLHNWSFLLLSRRLSQVLSSDLHPCFPVSVLTIDFFIFSVALEPVLEPALVDQADLELTEILLPLPPECWD